MDNNNTRKTTHSRELTEQQKQKLAHAKQQRFERIVSALSRNTETREKWGKTAEGKR